MGENEPVLGDIVCSNGLEVHPEEGRLQSCLGAVLLRGSIPLHIDLETMQEQIHKQLF